MFKCQLRFCTADISNNSLQSMVVRNFPNSSAEFSTIRFKVLSECFLRSCPSRIWFCYLDLSPDISNVSSIIIRSISSCCRSASVHNPQYLPLEYRSLVRIFYLKYHLSCCLLYLNLASWACSESFPVSHQFTSPLLVSSIHLWPQCLGGLFFSASWAYSESFSSSCPAVVSLTVNPFP